MRTDTQTLADALDVLAREIDSQDGVANAAIAEAADRLRALGDENSFARARAIVAEEKELEFESEVARLKRWASTLVLNDPAWDGFERGYKAAVRSFRGWCEEG